MGGFCDTCGGDLLSCTHEQHADKPRTKTIVVQPEDAKIGDIFTGTTSQDGATISVTGPLKGGAFHGNDLYVILNTSYALTFSERDGKLRVQEDKWRDWSITREVPVKTRLDWIKELPVGTWFKSYPAGNLFIKVTEDRIDRIVTLRDGTRDIKILPITAYWWGSGEHHVGDYGVLDIKEEAEQ